MQGYEQLSVYKKSYKAALGIYKMSSRFPNEELYGITNQIKKAAVSIPLNIAEGYAKKESQAEFKRFLMMAIGSSDEVCVLLDFSKDLQYIEELMYERAKAEYKGISKMLNSLIQAVSKQI